MTYALCLCKHIKKKSGKYVANYTFGLEKVCKWDAGRLRTLTVCILQHYFDLFLTISLYSCSNFIMEKYTYVLKE